MSASPVFEASYELEALLERMGSSASAGLESLTGQQTADGSWHGDYGGPIFLIPAYVICCHAMAHDPGQAVRDGVVRYLLHHQRGDGGWGLHDEGESKLFPSALCYVALRLWGQEADSAAMVSGRGFLHAGGGAQLQASWGRFFLALINLTPWDALAPIPPELWLLPKAAPMHPSRMWCHSRMVYLPMSWLYGRRWTLPLSPVTAALREELFVGGWDAVDWKGSRDAVAASDAYIPRHRALKPVNAVIAGVTRLLPRRIKDKALDVTLEQIRREDANTNDICIGPINKILHCLVWHIVEPGGERVERHLKRLPDYVWEGAAGVHIQGYNSSQLWDTAFAMQALLSLNQSGLLDDAGRDRAGRSVRDAMGFVEANQIIKEVDDPAGSYRHPSVGGWPFSTRAHGWPITDCTAEGIKASLLAERFDGALALEPQRLEQAVDVILSLQNPEGGWATYEPTRGPKWLEAMNPSDIFADIMIDHSYTECTSACVQALSAMLKGGRLGGVRAAKVREAIAGGVTFLRGRQGADGSWEGSWGVCFSYGTWFGVEGLIAAGVERDHPAIQRAAEFLLAQQHPAGGWGESTLSCSERRWVHAKAPKAVMTSWALLVLALAGRHADPAVAKGVEVLMDLQGADGVWPEEGTAGVFNRTCGIHYDAYRHFFPLWAMAEVAGAVQAPLQHSLQ